MTEHVNHTLIVAVGSSHGDDQAAWHVADLLSSSLCRDTRIVKASVPLNMIDWLENVDRLYIIDACEGGGDVGQLLRLSWPDGQLTKLRAAGTHDFDVPSVLDLAEKLNRLPPSISIWAIVGENFAPQRKISDRVEGNLPAIAKTIGKAVNHA